jgi:hypothetical protein
LFEQVLIILSGIASGYFGVLVGVEVLGAVMKDRFPKQAIGAGFIIWLAANYALHFIFFPENTTDFEVYAGLITSAVAGVTTWFVFRLPPLSP